MMGYAESFPLFFRVQLQMNEIIKEKKGVC